MATYKIKGGRLLRKYRAQNATFSYMALSDAEKVAANLCNLPWEEVTVKEPTFPAHSGTSEELDAENVSMQDSFDAALFCAEHLSVRHRAYANAACYRFTMPESAIGKSLTEIKAKVYCDPYNANGARISVYVSDDENPPMECAVCRLGSSEDDSAEAQTDNGTETAAASEWYSTNTHVEGVAPRKARDGSWYTNSGYAVIRPDGGLKMKKYLFVFVLMENYAVARAGFLEGAAYADGVFELSTTDAVEGLVLEGVNDLSALDGEYAGGDYDVVCGGVYPSCSSGVSGVRTLTLQRNGDAFTASEHIENEGVNGLFRLVNGRLYREFGISTDQITCMHQSYILVRIPVYGGEYHKVVPVVVVGGTFTGGTFEGLDGLLIYYPAADQFLTGGKISDLRDHTDLRLTPEGSHAMREQSAIELLAGFIHKHGGLAGAIIAFGMWHHSDNPGGSTMSVSTPYQNFVGLIASDGTTVGNSESGAIFPLFTFDVLFPPVGNAIVSAWATAISTTAVGTASEFGEVYNVYDSVSVSPDSRLIVGQQLWGVSSGSGRCLFSVAIHDISGRRFRIRSFCWQFGLREYDDEIYANSSLYVESFTLRGWKSVGYSGIVTGVRNAPRGVDGGWGGFIVAGDISALGNTPISNVGIITIQPNFAVGEEEVTTSVVALDWADKVTPDNYNDYAITYPVTIDDSASKMKNSITAPRPTSFLVSGDFRSLAGDTSLSRLVRVTLSEDKASYRCLVKIGNDITNPVWALDLNPLKLGVLSAFSPVAARRKYYTNLHPNVTDEQSAAGLRTLYGRFNLQQVKQVAVPVGADRPGAMFVVRGESVTVPTSNGTTVVPLWQMTSSYLLLPFALPSWAVKKIRLSWAGLQVTPGSKLNVWAKDEFVEEYPIIDDPSIYDASNSEVAGWRLVGVINASGEADAELPISLSGRVATLMLTAYVSMDNVNPSTDMELPVGVGDVNVDSVNGVENGLDTGWRPSITLLG